METEIGSYEAKANLSRLLKEVQEGRRYTITSRGRPVAELVPYREHDPERVRSAIEAMQRMEKIGGVADETVAEWIREGRE